MPDLSIPVDLFGNDLLIGVLSVFAAGLIRGFSGFGSALINAPILSLVWGPLIGVPVAALVEIAPAIHLTPRALKVAHWKTVFWIAVPAVILMPAGALVLINAPSDAMRRGIALIVLVLVAILWSGWRYKGPRGVVPSLGVGATAGALAGATGAGGPPAILYLMSGNDEAATVRANLIGYFTIIFIGFVATYGMQGLITADVLWRIALLVPAFVVGTAIGTRMFGLASERTFRNIALSTLAASSTWVLLA